MANTLNSVLSFSSATAKLHPKHHHVSKYCSGVSVLKASQITPFLFMSESRMLMKDKRWGHCLSVADQDHLAMDTGGNDSGNAEGPNELPSVNRPAQAESTQYQSNVTQEVPNGFSQQKQLSATSPRPKKSTLTARERLRAARVLSSQYTESKATKSQMGSKVLDALKESDGGKRRSGLPEAPTNLFDDSKRGLPKPGLTFQFPGGADLFIIALSFVFISTVMLATTYIVWKVGAIHFNE